MDGNIAQYVLHTISFVQKTHLEERLKLLIIQVKVTDLGEHLFTSNIGFQKIRWNL